MGEVIKLARARLFPGGIAGQMLLDLLRCAEHHTHDVSVKKACHLRSKIIMDTLVPAGKGQWWGESTYRGYWTRYRSVAHLWAAHMLWKEWDKPSETFFSEDPEDPEDLKEFLSLAEALRKRGERAFSESQWNRHGPALDPRSTWRAPADLVLPEFLLTVSPFGEDSLSILESYKNQTRRD
jgi:hypothetical protein